MVVGGDGCVWIDRCSRRVGGGRRGGWGIFGGRGDPRNEWAAPLRPGQASQRAERVCDRSSAQYGPRNRHDHRGQHAGPAEAPGLAGRPCSLGPTPKKLGPRNVTHIGKLDAVFWVKAHLDDNEAARRAEAGGHLVEWHALNKGAVALASKGVNAQDEDARLQALQRWGMRRTRQHWLYLRSVYRIVRREGQRSAQLGLTSRRRAERTKPTEKTKDRVCLEPATSALHMGSDTGLQAL